MRFHSYTKVRNGFQQQGEQHDDSFAEQQEKRSEDCLQQTAFPSVSHLSVHFAPRE